MSKSLLDLSGKIDPPLVEIFEAIADVTASTHIRYFVVGATARDMVLSHGHGIDIKRATADIDLGVEVAEMLPETRKVVLEILDRETDNPERYCLVEDMMDNYTVPGNEFEERLQHLAAFKAGIEEG